MITLNELKDGNLEIVLNDKAELETLMEKSVDENNTLSEMLDNARYLGNDWDVPTNLGLTEVPAIAWGLEYGHEGDLIDMEKLWIFPNYMIDSFLETLKTDGRVIFQKYSYLKL